MRKTPVPIALAVCLLAGSLAALAQAMIRPGLWQMTSTLTWQKTPLPPGVALPPGFPNPFQPVTRTKPVCMTQQAIDQFGAPFAYSQGKENCTVSKIVHTSGGLTAEMICTGAINGHGTVESSWPTGVTAHGTAHFTGTVQMGSNTVPVEYTVESTSTYKSADCGSVPPLSLPASK